MILKNQFSGFLKKNIFLKVQTLAEQGGEGFMEVQPKLEHL